MLLILRGLVLAVGYAALWFALARLIPSWLTVAAAAIWLPVAQHFHWIRGTTAPSLLLVVSVVGATGAVVGRYSRRRLRANSQIIS